MFEGLSEKEKLQMNLQKLHLDAKKADEAHRRDIRYNVETRWPATQLFLDTWFDIKNSEYMEATTNGNRA